ncbi:MAG: cation diffusion facilitator family transporter, partial [Clostridia bacterium]|nr:cation diffusion facilitator family transporter [Clostridia bacterium]
MEQRQTKRGQIASAVGIALNAALAALKITFGLLFGLVSLLADGVNNLSDCGSGTVSLVSLRISNKPADKEHPYGHQRAEYVASMLIGFFVLLLAVELLRESIEKMIAGALPEAFWGIYVLLGVSVCVKAFMFFLYRYAAKREGADTLRAAAMDSLCDCIATLAVVAGLLIARFGNVAADGYAGLAVAIFIVWQGVQIVREASSKLLGQAPDPA